MTINRAALIQQQREAQELANHQERVRWLTGDAPTWACGAPVDPSTIRVLLNQSRAVLARARLVDLKSQNLHGA